MKILYSASDIAQKVQELGQEISSAYRGQDLLIVGILKGGFVFMSDLIRHIDLPIKIGFARLSSYGNADCPQSEVKVLDDLEDVIEGKHVLIVDDIMDTGNSLIAFKKRLEKRNPASVKICTMIDKTFRRRSLITPDYYGFRLSDGFIVGYGLDYAENYRALPDIYVLDSMDREGSR
ncbi:MAG: hypoxanthine phosphoribosyltransferase [Desulfomonilia bacterium]|nr:hypoxanthine phosphoribosyltransferase [Desulfomonilia bacterium]